MNKINFLRPKTIAFNRALHPESPDARNKILSWWKEYSKSNPKFYNGDLVACRNYQIVDDNRLVIDWYISNYAHYLLRSNIETEIAYARSIYCSVVLVTNSGTIAIGKMSSTTSTPNRLQLPGGNLELDSSGFITLDSCVGDAVRELKEEVGLIMGAAQLVLWGVKTGGQFGDIGFIFKNRELLDEVSIMKAFNSHLARLKDRGISPEVNELLFLSKNNQQLLGGFKVVDYLPYITDEILAE